MQVRQIVRQIYRERGTKSRLPMCHDVTVVQIVEFVDFIYIWLIVFGRRSQWPRDLRCRSTAARLLRSWVRIPPGAWMSVCCECCVLSGRGLCDELITHPEESYRLWCVDVCDLGKTNKPREWGSPDPLEGYRTKRKKTAFGPVHSEASVINGCISTGKTAKLPII